MAESQHKILRQERAGGRLDSQIEDLRRSLEIVGVCPYGTVMIALYKKLLSWKLFQKITGTKKEVPLCCDTSVYSLDKSIYQLPLQ